MHPRNRHQGHYDFAQLVQSCPELAGFLIQNPSGGDSIDFADADSVRVFNRAILHSQYGILHWDLAEGYLCPPIPGRADYLHGLADLLSGSLPQELPAGQAVRVLDIGVGANCIYPLLGHASYGWQFVGTDIDANALRAAQAIVNANTLGGAITLRLQTQRGKIFAGMLQAAERFDLCLCNPPFHSSAAIAESTNRRKWRNFGVQENAVSGALNFGGKGGELWCTGGEASFIKRMINESAAIPTQVLWFSSLVSKAGNVPDIYKQLKKIGAVEVLTVPMAQGNKQSRFVAWSFLDAAQRSTWVCAKGVSSNFRTLDEGTHHFPKP
jgi:23S rRNA (adenine1618-N6)-methyltransferase